MLELERADERMTVRLNRPEVHNAIHPDQLATILELLDSIQDDADLRQLVLTGTGEKAFSAGFDIKALSAADPDGPPPSEILFEVTAALIACAVPTLAVIRGHCIGAGLDLAISCDHRIASPKSTFSLPAAKLGTVYQPRSLERLNSIIGTTASKRLAVCGHTFDAAQALRVGLVDEIIEPENLAEVAATWVAGSATVARAHKWILDSVASTPERSEEFWRPLDELRQKSVVSRDRADAIRDFVDANDSGDAG